MKYKTFMQGGGYSTPFVKPTQAQHESVRKQFVEKNKGLKPYGTPNQSFEE